MSAFKNQFKVTIYNDKFEATPDFVGFDINRVIKFEHVTRELKEKGLIEGVEPVLTKRRFVEVTLDEETEGSEPIPTQFDKSGNVSKAEPRKFKRNTQLTIIDEGEIDKFLSLVLID